jgi:EAL domain-containing protein (putative c-di-GMP-specific phosphodiesterase class I)
MPIVQAAIVRAVSALGDSLGISALAAGVHTSAQLAYTRSGWTSIQGFHETQADPALELAALHPCSQSRVSRFATTLRDTTVARGS